MKKTRYNDMQKDGGTDPVKPQRGNRRMIWRIVKYLLILAILAGLALVAYAYVGPVLFPADFAAPSEEVSAPVVLELD